MALKILLAHNYYQQSGGEDTVFTAEASLLREKGHTVLEYIEDNHRIPAMNKLDLAIQTVWSQHSYDKLSELIAAEKPDIAHFHNTFPLISPSAYYACRDANLPVIQTLHNYRLICPSAILFRDGHICEDCLARSIPWPAVLHNCYRNSRIQTTVVATMLATHRVLKTWNKLINTYIALTDFSRQKFIAGGLPQEKIVVKPNFVQIAPVTLPARDMSLLFVGRLVPYKGIKTLLSGWASIPNIPLDMAGDGPMKDALTRQSKNLRNIHWLGTISHEAVLEKMKSALALVFPSECYEGFPMTIIEAMACELPIIAAKLGGASEIISNGVTGLHFNPGDPHDLAKKVHWAWEHPNEMAEMGRNARHEYEEKYTAERNYAMSLTIYEHALSGNWKRDQ